MSTVWINGAFVDDSLASVPLRDTGLLHGAGVFTTMRAYGGHVFRLDLHLGRLRDSCDALFIPLQFKDDVLTKATTELLERNGLTDARLRLTVTRGSATQDPLHGTRLEPSAFLTAAPLEPYPLEYYEKGLTVILLDDQKLNPYDLAAGHKTLNYFSRLAALREANRRGAGEALWFNVHNYLQSGSITNVFLVRESALFTPPTPQELQEDRALAASFPYPKSNVLPGVARATVLEIASELKIETRRAALTVDDVLAADELFVTNSIMGVMPVCRIERHAVGIDEPGPITRRIMKAYENRVHAAVGPYIR